MSKKANPTLVGAFVLGALGLTIAGILVFSGGHFFQEKFFCVMYFDESIDGLDIGAPVDFQGVRIGTVTDVRMIMDRTSVTGRVYRPVTAQLEEGRITFYGEHHLTASPEEALEIIVQKEGLRAQLVSQSMLTGKLKVQLGLFPGTPIIRQQAPGTALWVMPTTPSTIQTLLNKLEDLPLQSMVNEAHRALKGIADLASAPEVRQTVTNLNASLERLDQLLATLNDKAGPLADKSAVAMDNASAAMKDIQDVLKKIERQIDPFLSSLTQAADKTSSALDEQSPIRYEALDMIKEFGQAAKSLRSFLDFLEQHPESMISGKK